jgi:hypothetical protein
MGVAANLQKFRVCVAAMQALADAIGDSRTIPAARVNEQASS